MNRTAPGIADDAATRLADWWHARAPRERWMLATMCAAIAAFVTWYGLLAPLQSARDRAAVRHASAIQAVAEVERSLALVSAAMEDRPAAPPAERFRTSIVDSAGAAGIGLDREEPSADGGLAVGIDAVSANALFAWLDTLRLEHGIAPVAVDVERRDGRLRARLHFGPSS